MAPSRQVSIPGTLTGIEESVQVIELGIVDVGGLKNPEK